MLNLFRDEELSYQKYKRRRAYHNEPFLNHIKKELETYNKAVFDNGLENKTFAMDGLALLKKLKKDSEKIDLIYLDPPYPSTMNNYIGFYGGFDKMFKRECENYLDFTKKDNFLELLQNLFFHSLSLSKFIALSLNNHCKPSFAEIQKSVNKYCKNIECFEKKHIYKVTGKRNKNIHNEILMLCELKV